MDRRHQVKKDSKKKAKETEEKSIKISKGYLGLFIKGFLLNFINIGVLLGWLGFIVIGTSITTSKNGVVIFITTMIVSYFLMIQFLKFTRGCNKPFK